MKKTTKANLWIIVLLFSILAIIIAFNENVASVFGGLPVLIGAPGASISLVKLFIG